MRVPPRAVTRPESGSRRPRQNLHECGFTVTVATHNADAVALINADGHPLENSAGRELKVQRFAAK